MTVPISSLSLSSDPSSSDLIETNSNAPRRQTPNNRDQRFILYVYFIVCLIVFGELSHLGVSQSSLSLTCVGVRIGRVPFLKNTRRCTAVTLQ